MLASRSQHSLFTDKENGHVAATSRKAASSTSTSMTAFKTPGGGGANGKSSLHAGNGRTAVKGPQTAYRQQQDRGKLAMTVAAEPGARVLGVKDANNRNKLSQTAVKDKGKGKEGSSSNADCNEILPKVLFKDALATQNGSKTTAGQSSKPLHKTPARASTSKPPGTQAFKTPSLAVRKALQTPKAPQPDLSMFKTPSPNMLGRKRIPGHTPPHLQFAGLTRPTSLLEDGDTGPLGGEIIEPPTLLDLLQEKLDQIDEEQEVEYAGTSSTEFDEAYTPDFDMPVYADLNLRETCFFPCYQGRSSEPIDYGLDDEAILELEEPLEIPQRSPAEIDPPLFPREAALFQLKQQQQKTGAPKGAIRSNSASVSRTSASSSASPSRGSLRSSKAPSLQASTAGPSSMRSRPHSAAPPSRIHSRAGSTTSAFASVRTVTKAPKQRKADFLADFRLPIEEIHLTL